MSLTIRLLNYLSRRSRLTVWLITASTILVLGVIDYLTGAQVAITFFYLLPVSLASWSLGKNAGRVAAFASALFMQAGQLADDGGIYTLPLLWNLAVRLGVFLVVANLISEFRHLLKHQTELSRTDPLTGILNRRAFLEAGEIELARMCKHTRPLTLAFMDIDDFKAVNDASGHAEGDRLLIAVADCLKSQLWGTDIVARLGGDEYAILLPHTSPAAAQKVLPRLKDTLLDEMAKAKWPVTFSIGVVTCTDAPAGVDELLHLADQLMYTAKGRGKNRIEYEVTPEASHADQEARDEAETARLLETP